MPPCPVDDTGHFTKEVTDFKGMYFKDADKEIMKILKSKNRLIVQSTMTHSYPFCWRSHTPLMYRAIPAWFVRVQGAVDQLVANNRETRWYVVYCVNIRGKMLFGLTLEIILHFFLLFVICAWVCGCNVMMAMVMTVMPGYLKMLVTDDLAIGLQMRGIGISLGTDIGGRPFRCGSQMTLRKLCVLVLLPSWKNFRESAGLRTCIGRV